MAQKQQGDNPLVNPAPTAQELLEYKAALARCTSNFRDRVHVHGQGAYAQLIHKLKVLTCSLIADLVEADEQLVMQAIQRRDGQHFKQGFMVRTRSTLSREHHPDFSAKEYDSETNRAICKLHLLAADVSQSMAEIHYNLALIKTKVSTADFIKISTSIPLPLTTVEMRDPSKPDIIDVDSIRVCDHMPDPDLLLGNKATKLLGALVRFQMQNTLCKQLNAYSMAQCRKDFNLGRLEFERLITGVKRAGGHEYQRRRKMGDDEKPVSMVLPKGKKQNPVDKGATGLVPVYPCKYCDKVCATESRLINHINNIHQERQFIFRCSIVVGNLTCLTYIMTTSRCILRMSTNVTSVVNSFHMLICYLFIHQLT